MAYVVFFLVAGVAAYWAVQWRRNLHGQRAGGACPRCGSRLAFRERTFRGSAREQYWECSVADCGYRKPV